MRVALHTHGWAGLRPARPVTLALALLVATMVGIVLWFAYVIHYTFTLFECMSVLSGPSGHLEGGALGTEWVAAALGIAFLVLSAACGWRSERTRQRMQLVVGFAAAYAVALVLLGSAVAPAVQGARHCVYP